MFNSNSNSRFNSGNGRDTQRYQYGHSSNPRIAKTMVGTRFHLHQSASPPSVPAYSGPPKFGSEVMGMMDEVGVSVPRSITATSQFPSGCIEDAVQIQDDETNKNSTQEKVIQLLEQLVSISSTISQQLQEQNAKFDASKQMTEKKLGNMEMCTEKMWDFLRSTIEDGQGYPFGTQ